MAFRYLARMRAIVVLPVPGVAGKNHVHVHIGNFQALGLALLLGLHVLGNAAHKILYFVKAHNGI